MVVVTSGLQPLSQKHRWQLGLVTGHLKSKEVVIGSSNCSWLVRTWASDWCPRRVGSYLIGWNLNLWNLVLSPDVLELSWMVGHKLVLVRIAFWWNWPPNIHWNWFQAPVGAGHHFINEKIAFCFSLKFSWPLGLLFLLFHGKTEISVTLNHETLSLFSLLRSLKETHEGDVQGKGPFISIGLLGTYNFGVFSRSTWVQWLILRFILTKAG